METNPKKGMPPSLKHKAAKGIKWSAIERFSAQGVQFVIGLVLARLLSPSDFGLIGMLIIFIAVSETFVQSGFSQALVQKKNRDDLDYSTTFYFNIVVAMICYLLLYIAAPFIAQFYNEPQLVELTRVIGLTLIINSFSVVQQAKFTAEVDFKTQTKASFSSILISGCVGVYLAYAGYGVWALVVQTLLRRLINVLVLWYISKWVPKKKFSYTRFKNLFSFGSKLLLSSLINTIYNNIYTIIIGKVFSANMLGYYTRANQFGAFPSSNISMILQRVTFPVLSEVQDEDERLRLAYRKIIKLSALVVLPLMMGLAALAKPLIITILTDKWSEAIWMLQILCFALMWYPVHVINLNVIKVKGRSDWFLKLEIIKKIIISVVLVISIPLGIKAMLLGQVFTSLVALLINTHYTKKLIAYGFVAQMKDLAPILGLSLLIGAGVYGLTFVLGSMLLQLLVGTLAGAAFYLGIAWSSDIGGIREVKSLMKRK